MKNLVPSIVLSTALITTSGSVFAANNWQDDAKDAWIDGKAETTLLLNTNLNSFDINTDVKDGQLTLSGSVESEIEKSLAAELVANLDGVEKVDNQLTVVKSKQDQEQTDNEMLNSLTDSKISTVVKTRLLLESEISGTDIEVNTEDKVVTLSGEVSSDAEQDLALAIARNTNDVDEVVNQLSVLQ